MKKVKQPHGGAIVNAEKGETANPNGRPRKMTSQIIADLKAEGVEAVTPTNVSDAISVLLNLTKPELLLISGDDSYPILIQKTAHRLANAKERDWDFVINDNLDRAHGKAKQAHEFSGEITTKLNLDSLTLEEKRKALEILGKANGS